MDYDTNTPVLGETTDTYILDLVGNGIATAVTEPSSPLLLGMGLLVFGFMRRKTAAWHNGPVHPTGRLTQGIFPSWST